ncbi:MAG: tetraacyldisaccharide 4'-kinase [Bacteroidota bacterium]
MFLRYLLFPISGIYWIITFLRNYLYNIGIFKSYKIPVKAICIGNLSLGGTGKSPMTAYLVDQFISEKKIQILSRGYGRKTKGYIHLDENSTADLVGDEPLMYFKRFSVKHQTDFGVNVCESRETGIKNILSAYKPDLILLDDAFQHRKVQAGFSILLTDYSKLFSDDFILPVGTLREAKSGKNRADVIIVTKSPENLSDSEKKAIKEKLKFKEENIFFSSIKYTDLVSISETKSEEIENVILVTGIANPKPLEEFLKKKYNVETMRFSDHHNFSVEDVLKINKKFDTFASENKIIVTSEKDYMRLVAPQFSGLTSEKPWYFQQISIQIDQEINFLEKIKTYVNKI